jgi:hypothetical protein
VAAFASHLTSASQFVIFRKNVLIHLPTEYRQSVV